MSKTHTVTSLSNTDCNAFYRNILVDNGSKKTFRHPFTSEPLKNTSSKFRTIDKHCTALKNDPEYLSKLIAKWKANPMRDPIDNTKIAISVIQDSVYYKLYETAYNHLSYDLKVENVKEYLPNAHCLFNGSFDILFYIFNNREYIQDETTEYIIELLENNPSVPFISWEKLILTDISNVFSYCLAKYIRYCNLLFEIKFYTLGNYVDDISKGIGNVEFIRIVVDELNIYTRFTQFLFNRKKLRQEIYNTLLSEFDENDLNCVYPIVDNVIKAENIFEKLLEYYDELLNIYNYKSKPQDSPFENIDSVQFVEIEDPLITILQKIGQNNIDLETLEIPKRPFKNDDEYNKYRNKYDTLYKQYREDVQKWQDNDDKGDSSIQRTPPKKPTMNLPDGSVFDVSRMIFPYYIKDKEYKEIVKTYNENLEALVQYKELINIGILDLLQSSEQQQPDANVMESLPLLKKDRQYFLDNVLPYQKTSPRSAKTSPQSGKTSPQSAKTSPRSAKTSPQPAKTSPRSTKTSPQPAKTSPRSGKTSPQSGKTSPKSAKTIEDLVVTDASRCYETYDIIGNNIKHFTDPEYPLAKLQLMFQLKTSGSKRIDCFYAPNFYNHIVRRRNNYQKITNPVTNAILSDDDANKAVDSVMKIMKVLNPDIKTPYFSKPMLDKGLYMNIEEDFEDGNKYYVVSIARKISDYHFIVYDLCCIPYDIEISDTGSTDYTSAVFIVSLKKLFEDGYLMHQYVPPYYSIVEDYNTYIKIGMHFNNFASIDHWVHLTREQKIKKFIHYCEELKGFVNFNDIST